MVGAMRVVLIVLAIALVLYSLLDCARTPEEGLPARIPKFVWIILIILFPTVGAIAWIITSRVKAAEERGGIVEPTVWSSREGTTFHRHARPRPVAPDEDPEFLRSLERDIQRRRKKEAEAGQAPPTGKGAKGSSPDGSDSPSQADDTAQDDGEQA